MKKLMSLLFVIVLALITLPSNVLAAEAEASPSISVSYSDYVEKQQYYDEMKNKGYIVFIDINGVDQASINKLIYGSAKPTSVDILTPENKLRSAIKPGESDGFYWNVATQGARAIEGNSSSSTLYSSVRFYGATKYDITIYNELMKQLDYTCEGEEGSCAKIAIAPSSVATFTITRNSPSKSDNFYLAFEAPCRVRGSVSKAN